MPCRWMVFCLAAFSMWSLRAGEADGANSADLRFRIARGETLHYQWTIKTESQSGGREQGKPFTVSKNTVITMTQLVKGVVAKSEGMPVTLRVQDFELTDTRALDNTSKTELTASKNHIKYVEDGKVLVDSDNDIGIESLANWQKQIKAMENSEIHAVLDATGRQSDVSGETALAENLKDSAQTIFPVLPGKTVAVGESWTDSAKIQKLNEFKLARPAIENSKMTFARWETKNGRRLAVIELAGAWEKQDLKGENSAGLLAEFSGLEFRRTGSCLFDPAAGQFTEGTWEVNVKFHVDGEKDGQTVGVDVTQKTVFSFGQK